MRSAFESWPEASPRSSSAGDSSASAHGYEEDDATKRVRVVGFPEISNSNLELSRFASCSLDERPKRQSSLAQQLALEALEQEQKPKLRAINTKSKTLNIRTRRATPTAYHKNSNIAVQNGADNDNNRISFEFPSTLPSGKDGAFMNHHLHRGNSSGSEAVAIPQGLHKAYTAPQPLPELSELSPSLVAIIQGSNSGSKNPTRTTTPTQRGGRSGGAATTTTSRLLPSPASNQHSPPAHSSSTFTTAGVSGAAMPYKYAPQAAAERGALAQVAGLREALRQQQEEVARLQLELAKLAMQQQISRQRSGSADVQMTPVTPDAPDEFHQGSSRNGGGGGEIKSMSPDDEHMVSPFEGFAATVTAAQPPRGRGRAWEI